MKILILLIIFCFSNCLFAQNFYNDVTIIQNDLEKKVSRENDFITLKKEDSKIQFHSKLHRSKNESFNGLKATIVINERDLPVIEEGMAINLIPFFEKFSRIPTDDDDFIRL